METIVLVIGANGQLGSVLTESLKQKFGSSNVIASDLRSREGYEGSFEIIDATDMNRIEEVVVRYKVTQIYHLAAILSAKGEETPLRTWDINMKTLFNVLEVSRQHNIDRVFFPSSIAVFGEGAPLEHTPNNAYLDPATVYGISKAAGENWAQYYFLRYGLDVRSIRYPGVIGYQSLPGGGTTDYAVDIYHKAVLGEEFSCFLEEDTTLPMIFMEDAIRATLELMDAPKEDINIRTSYNIAGISFSPAEVAAEIRTLYPNFEIKYNPDFRQEIAARWPKSIDDSAAIKDWGWKPEFDLESITSTMIQKLKEKYKTGSKNQATLML
ncbi:nucleoside-diphosphate-sugar epimerase [Aquimarina sp. EL_43]|uniref:NAD-dependent epimerase/dehydratase family protein n=1 Tax=unclassified Aquimarina TaxID=2627091 RepID=UPI0018CBD0AD|nr:MULTISPECIES: NAD-dependent epimerase/dehydratase family protein [unclassified Aquimarina]MBG6131358.1 nucleoside-diphosphate-sugar epimerase [Aquimarina sp. EL_35]MBG6151759.1 nucleoside-diphosphate-sugar epimerase [Aquimarina sp. EL_32]MBG6169689.1 nucleoside-diphosphate-sugar epimerase [Aquimarina sp. EL_43]